MKTIRVLLILLLMVLIGAVAGSAVLARPGPVAERPTAGPATDSRI